jgi:hypothetical protein
MSDRDAFEKWAKGLLDLQHIGPCYGDEATQTAFEAWQAALQSGEPVVDVAGMDEEDAMFTQIEAKARATYRRHSFSAKGQIFTKADSYESHLVWAAIDWAKANTTPQPVVDVNQKLVEALQAVLDCGSTSNQWWIDKAREALLSAVKGGE